MVRTKESDEAYTTLINDEFIRLQNLSLEIIDCEQDGKRPSEIALLLRERLAAMAFVVAKNYDEITKGK